ncbi:MAG TPA: exosortase A [Dongiaceae bacterium]|nr:exosortase A [Dongiaceae bacterium]
MPAVRTGVPIWQIAALAGLVLWLYWSILGRLVDQWWHNPNFSHGFFVPLFSAYVIWHKRDRLARLPLQPSWSGFVVIALGLLVLILGQMGAELYLSRSSLLLVVAGLTIVYFGWNHLRAALFPWAFLFLMIPIPAIIFNEITFPLQLFTSRVAAPALSLLGVPVLREGNVMNLASIQLEVAEACSGIRSLMSLVTIAIIYAYLLEQRTWVRWLLAIASVPIAVIANGVRIVGTGLMAQYWDPEKAEGYFHASWGLIIWIISLVLFYGLHCLINLLWPDRSTSS